MKFFLTSAYDTHTTLDDLRDLAPLDAVGEHQTCSNPEEADVILFVENWHPNDYRYKRLMGHPLVKLFPEKTFMVNEVDKPWCALPGLYSSMPRRFFQKNRQRAFGFFKTPNEFVRDIYIPGDRSEREWLFSFVGAASHRCRKRLLQLSGDFPSIQDTSDFNVWHASQNQRASVGENFAAVMKKSSFILCPRGIGTSSFRLFEAMEAGRVPVIVSDQWVEPDCIKWDFVVRVPESDVHTLPEYLESIADEAYDRGEAARLAWEQSFAPNQVFNTAASGVASLAESNQLASTRIYFQDVRKVLIEGQIKFLQVARPIRDQLRAKLSERSETGEIA